MFRKITTTILLSALIFVGASTLAPTPAKALFQDINQQNDAVAGEDGASFTVTDDPRVVFARAVGYAMSILASLFLFYTIYGGVLIFISQGDQDQIKRGKSTIVTGVIGVTIMLSAYIITQFITDALVRSTTENDCATGAGCLYIEADQEMNTDPLAPPREGRQDDTFWENLR